VGLLVSLTSLALAHALIVIEALTMLLLPALNVPGGKMSVGDRIGWWLAGRDELVLRHDERRMNNTR
jgi:hypothetical protein